MQSSAFNIPNAAWTRAFDEPLDQVGAPNQKLSPAIFLKMLPMIFRLVQAGRKRKAGGFDPINLTAPEITGPYQGVPLGGLGAGSIGRGWRGEFRRWTLRPGFVHNPPVWADQFSVYAQRHGAEERARARVLFPDLPETPHLAAWNWELPAEGSTYRALFPRAWTEYGEPLPGVRLTCRQLSPVIAHNYRESSYPAAEFRWRIENTGPDPVTVGLMLTFQNGAGWANDAAGGHANRPFRLQAGQETVTGVLLRHAYRQAEASLDKTPAERKTFEDPLTFAIAARSGPGCAASYRARFATNGSGADVWKDFAADGRLDDLEDARPSVAGETIGAAVALTVDVPPGESREAAFALAWDMPVVRSGFGTAYTRRYARFFGAQGDAAARLAAEALAQADAWEEQITAWQNPILEDPSLPEGYRAALFNELYYLVDGGTIWAYPLEGAPPDPEMGHFAYLEGHEYRMYNTYDVHFYASWALAMLWPKLELALQRDTAAATLAELPDTYPAMFDGRLSRRKVRGAVPHDLGLPEEDPWRLPNGYNIHDTNVWKDLNPKFVLQVYRDYRLTGDRQFLEDTWPAVEAAIQYARAYDRDGDGLIENDGAPDQTYDVWSVKGPSAYTGGLWLACLDAGAALAEAFGRPQQAAEYRELFARARPAYEDRLWNGRYYNYDSSNSRYHEFIMADQLAGQWYARACGLPPIVDPQRARTALTTIFEWNVMRFMGGKMGAVNGMRPDGRVDRTSLQSQEVWTGTTYALAAAMIQEGLREHGLATAEGVWRTTYHGSGYWFQTPEAWNAEGNYRSIAYMRPLAIWAVQWALEKTQEA